MKIHIFQKNSYCRHSKNSSLESNEKNTGCRANISFEISRCYRNIVVNENKVQPPINLFKSILFKATSFFLLSLIPISFLISHSEAKENENTYSISLVKTAGISEGEEVKEVGNKKVLTSRYLVQKGDYIFRILRKKNVLKKTNSPEILSMLKNLNPSLKNLDLIHPGQTVIIPLKIAPISGKPMTPKITPVPVKEETVSITDLKDIKLEGYTIKPGDSLTKVIKERYGVPRKKMYNEYLSILKKLNPNIKDVNLVYPGQKIRLPIYSPEIVTKPIPRPVMKKKEIIPEIIEETKDNTLGTELGKIFVEMEEGWIQTGKHFVPLKSGGQIDLNAESFPLVDLKNGRRIIIDLHNKLPMKMANLIMSSWENYRIVHLDQNDDLRSAMNKILKICKYPKVRKAGEPLELGGDIPVGLMGDWIINVSEKPSVEDLDIKLITITGSDGSGTPWMIKDYLAELGIKVIDYPPDVAPESETIDEVPLLIAGSNSFSLIENVLTLIGQKFSTRVQMPVFQSQKEDFKLVVKADFFLNINGQDGIIDTTGLGPDIISFLKEHRFRTLSLAKENDPVKILSSLFDFLGQNYSPGPQIFYAAKRDKSKNVRLSIPGTIFSGADGRKILATELNLPDEIKTFLFQRYFRVLSLTSF